MSFFELSRPKFDTTDRSNFIAVLEELLRTDQSFQGDVIVRIPIMNSSELPLGISLEPQGSVDHVPAQGKCELISLCQPDDVIIEIKSQPNNQWLIIWVNRAFGLSRIFWEDGRATLCL